MINRILFQQLEHHLFKKQVTVITGMRRVGKSTAVKYLLQRLEHDNYLYLDCERVEVRALFGRPNYESIREELELTGLDFSRTCLIAIDEIQLVDNLPSIIKYFYDTYHIKFVVTGSSSFYIKNTFSESLAGRKRIFEMTPLTFREFMVFKGVWSDIYERYSWKSFNKAWYSKAKDWYQEYMRFGGFPEVVMESNEDDKTELLKDIINSYIELDVKLLSDYSVSEELYNLAKLLAARAGNKIGYSKLSSISGISRQKITSYMQLLEHTYFIFQAPPFTKNIDREISQQKKLYFSDSGILQVLGGKQLSAGQIFENTVAIQLKASGDLQFYQRKTGQEIDFIFNEDVALEVKGTPLIQDKNTLAQRAAPLKIDKQFVIGHSPPRNGFEDFLWAGSVF